MKFYKDYENESNVKIPQARHMTKINEDIDFDLL